MVSQTNQMLKENYAIPNSPDYIIDYYNFAQLNMGAAIPQSGSSQRYTRR